MRLMTESSSQQLDVKGLSCPLPILRAKKALSALQSGQTLEVLATDGGAWDDFEYFCQHSGHVLMERAQSDGVYRFLIRRK